MDKYVLQQVDAQSDLGVVISMGGGTGGYRGYMYPPPFLEGGYKRVHSESLCVSRCAVNGFVPF